ncbi:MAG: oxygenase MpaB family protein, partial [Saprospiraceae bacterium]
MKYFVDQSSIVRTIWSKGDTVLFVFAGAAAEFALNKAVDWLYFTGRLPADPLGRLFSTMMYARRIIFSDQEGANKTIDQIRAIHTTVEINRGSQIPDWAYRDVLFMLIHYSHASFELLERKMTEAEKEELYDVFHRLGLRMGLKELPVDYRSWLIVRDEHMNNDLIKGDYTLDLFKQYRKHLGGMRYRILIEGQKLVVPEQVRHLLNFGKLSLFVPLLAIYKLSRKIKMDWFLKSIFLP